MSMRYTLPVFSDTVIVKVITLAPPDFPRPFEVIAIRIFLIPGLNSVP